MLPSLGYQGFRISPIPSGWVQTRERWAIWYNGRETASVSPDRRPILRLWMQGQTMWQVKEARVANVRQGKRFAECWCAARLYPGLLLREAVARLTDSTSVLSAPPLPGLPPTREQRQLAERLDEAAATASAWVMAALQPIRAPVATKPRAKDPMKAWVRSGRRQLEEHRRV